MSKDVVEIRWGDNFKDIVSKEAVIRTCEQGLKFLKEGSLKEKPDYLNDNRVIKYKGKEWACRKGISGKNYYESFLSFLLNVDRMEKLEAL